MSGQRFGLFLRYKDDEWGVYMFRAHWTTGVRDDAIIAFLLFCLEVYQTEQQRKRTLH